MKFKATLLIAVLGVVVATQIETANAAQFQPGTGRPFADTSPFNMPISSGAQLSANSSSVVKQLATGQHGAAIENYGVPIYDANASTPKRSVPCTEDWGKCPTEGPVPIPANAKPALGSDKAMVVIDWSTRIEYDYWLFDGSKTGWSNAQSVDGDGRAGGAVGAGISRLAGVVRTYEIANGQIDHALVFSSDMSCKDTFVYPATKSDGSNMAGGSACLPEGARVQLDPTLNLDSMSGLSKADRIVGKALQKYGAYNIDNGGARMAFVMEAPFGKSDPYPAAGVEDYQNFNLPWSKLRVLKDWQGGVVSKPSAVAAAPAPAKVTLQPKATAVVKAVTPAPVTSTQATGPDKQAPPASASVVVTKTANSAISIKWAPSKDNVATTRYEVWRGDANYENWVLIGRTSGSVTAYADKSVKAGVTYTYGIRSFDAANNRSGPSPRVRAIAPDCVNLNWTRKPIVTIQTLAAPGIQQSPPKRSTKTSMAA